MRFSGCGVAAFVFAAGDSSDLASLAPSDFLIFSMHATIARICGWASTFLRGGQLQRDSEHELLEGTYSA